MNIIKIIITSFIMGLSGAMMPGPLLAVTITETIKKGFKAAVLIIVGHSVLELFLTGALALGLGSFIKNNSIVTGLIGIVGGSVLMWMAFGMIVEARKSKTNDITKVDEKKKRRIGPFGLGIVISASNPYWTIWWVTIGASYLLVHTETKFLDISAFYFGHISSDFVWYSLVGLAIVYGKQIFSTKFYKWLLIVCGVFLIFMAIYFLYSGGRFLLTGG